MKANMAMFKIVPSCLLNSIKINAKLVWHNKVAPVNVVKFRQMDNDIDEHACQFNGQFG